MSEPRSTASLVTRQMWHHIAVERAAELMETLRVLGQASMTWWVSATVLCAAILGLSWSHREEIRRAGRWATHALFGLAMIFFISICAFGVAMMVASVRLGGALMEACARIADPVTASCLPSDAEALRWTITVGVGIGTTSFILFALAWMVAWLAIVREVDATPMSNAVTEVADTGALARDDT